ncbi:MAG TPA: hypothetical protein VK211_27475, partial [Kamptonema sp.]|nr:hypothetical protein [Kamptonema sp.]
FEEALFEEALVSCNRAIELSEKYVSVFFNRVIAILGLNRWDEGIAALEYAFQNITPENEVDVEDIQLMIRILFKSTDRVEVWRSRLTTLVNIYEKHNVLPALGQGLVNNIPEIMSEMISDKAARIWLEVWQEQTSKFDDFQIPLRLLNTAVRYRETKGDRRALLELAIEERKLLQSILDLDQ